MVCSGCHGNLLILYFYLYFRMKQHYENYEPTLKALRQKYEVKEQGDISYIFL